MRHCASLVFFISQFIGTLIVLGQTTGGGTIFGRVTAQGRPIQGANISVYHENGTRSEYTANIITSTDEDGNYRLQVNPGIYIVIVTIQGNRVYQGETEIVANNPSKNDIELAPATDSSDSSRKPGCTSVVNSLTIFERTYAQLAMKDDSGKVYVYADDMHRTPFHANGTKNELYVFVYEGNSPKLASSGNLGQNKKAKLNDLRVLATRSTELSYEGPGPSITFLVHGVSYQLKILATDKQVGGGNQSVSISVCRQLDN